MLRREVFEERGLRRLEEFSNRALPAPSIPAPGLLHVGSVNCQVTFFGRDLDPSRARALSGGAPSVRDSAEEGAAVEAFPVP